MKDWTANRGKKQQLIPKIQQSGIINFITGTFHISFAANNLKNYNKMKTNLTIILLSVMFASLTVTGQDSISNRSFEYWNTNSPKFWETTNIFLPPEFYTCSKTTDSYEGDYAMKLKSVKIDESVIPGCATLGHIVLYDTEGGIPYTQMPAALHAFIKHPSSGDNIMIAVEFFNKGEAIGGGVFQTTDSIPDYTEVVIPISFSKVSNPDTVNITILTDMGVSGSTLIIDNLSFDIQTSTDKPSKSEKDVLLYPNPASKEFFIEFPVGRNYEIVVMNTSGQIVEKRNSVSGKEKFNIDGIIPGLYFVNSFSNGQTFSKKLIIK